MVMNASLIAIIARKYPAVWEEIIGPLGPMSRFDAVALNPQPLPPIGGGRVSLNPQPIPPGIAYGAAVGAELVRTAGIARLLRVPFEVDVDDICPPWPKWPPFPWPPVPWPPEPYPWRRGDREFEIDYAIGLAFSLEASAHAWEGLDAGATLERVHERVLSIAAGGAVRG